MFSRRTINLLSAIIHDGSPAEVNDHNPVAIERQDANRKISAVLSSMPAAE